MNVISAWKAFDIKSCIDSRETVLENLWTDVAVMHTENETLSEYADIFQVSHTIEGEGFYDITIEDINELFKNVVIFDDEILQNFIESDCNDNKENEEDREEQSSAADLCASLIQNGLNIAMEIENHLLNLDPNTERSARFQRQLNEAVKCYRELYEEVKAKKTQRLITDFFKS
ncbi:uncharacterized protein LOC126765365 [Bactrocera neohumeralis]|uniref:uncharacterized protein LOC126765365 n=1 Tax=Bactrocera neohumeralis TaxID=98809 RepID=UPI00216694AA|nr:uncharacterized protein LOC126765365 [Bactrocera neohumeralis]